MCAVLAGLALIVGAGLASAKGGKPPKPPPEPPPPADTGVIYYGADQLVNEMDTDGTGKTALPAIPSRSWIPPSHKLHDGERWFLELRPIDGQFYPNGLTRVGLYAVSQSGTAVQLTNAPNIEFNGIKDHLGERQSLSHPTWVGQNDLAVSYLAKEWAQDPNDEWFVETAGIYVLSVDPDDFLHHTAGTPTRLPIEFPLQGAQGDHKGFVNAKHGWSPAGTSVVYFKGPYGDLKWYRADEVSGTWTENFLRSGWSNHPPQWSPDGTKIAISGHAHIETMKPDGTGQTTIIAAEWNKSVRTTPGSPFWSPSGSHLVYVAYYEKKWGRHQPIPGDPSDVWRALADGSDRTNLTEDLDLDASPKGWVDE
ncbi:MAG: TolB family protein [Planctomycetota bacterium]|jgi:hypothetical protein